MWEGKGFASRVEGVVAGRGKPAPCAPRERAPSAPGTERRVEAGRGARAPCCSMGSATTSRRTRAEKAFRGSGDGRRPFKGSASWRGERAASRRARGAAGNDVLRTRCVDSFTHAELPAAIVLTSGYWINWAHFLTEVLPKALIAERRAQWRDWPMLISSSRLANAEELLRLLVAPDRRIVKAYGRMRIGEAGYVSSVGFCPLEYVYDAETGFPDIHAGTGRRRRRIGDTGNCDVPGLRRPCRSITTSVAGVAVRPLPARRSRQRRPAHAVR